jgi:hypothetical protein
VTIGAKLRRWLSRNALCGDSRSRLSGRAKLDRFFCIKANTGATTEAKVREAPVRGIPVCGINVRFSFSPVACDTFKASLRTYPMDHPCHKCAQAVEDGVAFCSHCGSPQIRVAIAQAPPDLPLADEPVSAPDHPGLPGAEPLPAGSFAVLWHRALPACAIAALAAALLMCLGLMVPFLAMLGAGFLAVVLYRRRTLGAFVKASTGAQLGAVSGVFSFGMAAVIEAVGVALFRSGAQIRSKMLEAIQQAASRTSDPQAQTVFDYFKSPAGMAVMMIFVLVFALISFVVLGGVGGALGGVFFSRRDRK